MASKARVLAIDEQLYFRSLIEGLLSEEGYDVQTAGGYPAALTLLDAAGPFDLVIMDVKAPTLDGVDVVAELRERFPTQQVIVVSGIADVESVVSSMKRGAADYLLKPIDRHALLQSIEAVLEERPSSAAYERLVGENLEFMGRLSLLERAMPVLGLKSPLEVGTELLDLVRTESGARDGLLWLYQGGSRELRAAVAQGETSLETSSKYWQSDAEGVPAGLEAGRPLAITSPEPALFVPVVRDDELLAVIRVSAPASGQFPEAATRSCEKLAEIGGMAIANAFEVCELRETSFRHQETGLATRAFLERVVATEIHKAHRYGRRFSCLCVELESALAADQVEGMAAVVSSLVRTLRSSDIIAAEDRKRFWILLAETDLVGVAILKRRIADSVAIALESFGNTSRVAVGAAGYPGDGAGVDELMRKALDHAEADRLSSAHELGIRASSTLAEISEILLAQAEPLREGLVVDAAELVLGDLSCRPNERGILFLASGTESEGFLAPLNELGHVESATEIFLAAPDGQVPTGVPVTSVAFPPNVPADTTWIVRYGDAPPYALIARPPKRDGTRAVYHSADPLIVEQLTIRLRAEVAFGVRT